MGALAATVLRCPFWHAGSSLQPQPVLEAVKRYQECEALYGGYEAARR